MTQKQRAAAATRQRKHARRQVVSKEKRKRERRKVEKRGRRYTSEFKQECMTLLGGGKTMEAVAEQKDVSTESLRRWKSVLGLPEDEPAAGAPPAEESAGAPDSGATDDGEPTTARGKSRAPKDNIAGLSQVEIDEILALKKDHFTMGPAQLRAQLKRFHGWRISVKAIAQVLKRNGYQVEHRSAREEQELMRFEAPHPNSIWQMDAMYFRVHEQRLYLNWVLDDFSRFIVGYSVSEELTSSVATATLQSAIAKHGKPERVLTDRGGQFMAVRHATAFKRFLEQELIDHSTSRPYHPQTLGKVESLNRSIQKELIYLHEFGSEVEARARIADWVEEYNFRRAHLGIDGVCPADRYFGLHDRVLAEIQARSRGRAALTRAGERIGSALEDLGGPLEILRLVLLDGRLELRFCGLRFVLGQAAQ